MTTLAIRTAHLRRVGAAALLGAATLFGTTTGTVVNPANACAGPKEPGFDKAGYDACVQKVVNAGEDAVFNDRPWGPVADAFIECCLRNGGMPHLEDSNDYVTCEDPAENNEYPAPPGGIGQLPQLPGPLEATRVPPPPPSGPIAQLPGVPPVQTR